MTPELKKETDRKLEIYRRKNQTAENILMKKWKLPLEILLHAQHYRKER